jgi:hypothetical protein
MDALTREDIIKTAGVHDETLIVRIMETGASKEDIADAVGWLTNDEAMAEARRHRPTGLADQVFDILDAARIDDGDVPREAPGTD